MTAPPVPRGRLAPSPTGLLHLGNAYAFLMAWLSVRSKGGSLVLRMEDIDPDRSKPEFVTGIYEDLDWLGLDCDEGPARSAAHAVREEGGPHAEGPCGPYEQSKRLGLYDALLADFCRKGLAYPCYCTRKELRMLASAPHVGDEGAPYPGTCRSLTEAERAARESVGRRPALRLNTDAALRHAAAPCALLSFCDGVLGPQRFSLADCGGDFALRRSDGVVAYQLAVVADDAAMGITEVVRGDDLLLSTPRQILLFRLLGNEPPDYAHVPLLHDAAGERLAKRHKSLALASLRAAGAAPEAVVGYLGWLAGFLERPQPARPGEMSAAFSLESLRGRYLRLPEDAAAHILALR